LRSPTGECSLLGGVGIPAALWHTYHSLKFDACAADRLPFPARCAPPSGGSPDATPVIA